MNYRGILGSSNRGEFLGMNGVLYRPDGSKRLADNALVALTLLNAESRPDEKETIVKVIVNLINRKND